MFITVRYGGKLSESCIYYEFAFSTDYFALNTIAHEIKPI